MRIWRARILGDSLLYAQTHDPNPSYTDGRLRDSYFVAPSFVTDGGPVQLDGAPAYLNGTAVGNVAWAGLALARLYAYTGGRSYLDGALNSLLRGFPRLQGWGGSGVRPAWWDHGVSPSPAILDMSFD